MEDFLNRVPSYMFMPSFTGIPKPEVFLNKFNKNGKTIYYCYSGLWKQIVDWCNMVGVEVQFETDERYFKYR